MANFLDKWGSTIELFRQWLLIPVCSGLLMLGKLYIDNHYVDRDYFYKAMMTLGEDKAKYAQEQKQDTKEIIGKLDTIIVQQAANTQRLTESERRLSRLEDKANRF